jgi:plasmid maintenance system antidote protein VapI
LNFFIKRNMSATNATPQLTASPFKYRWHLLLAHYTKQERVRIVEQLAKELGVAQITINRYFDCGAPNGSNDIPTKHALHMAKRFGVSIQEVMNYQVEAQPFTREQFTSAKAA